MKQTISKITLITGLLFTNVVKSQEFYTCVPKEDWVKNVSKSLQRSDEEIRNLARQVKRSDDEVKNLAKQVRRTDSEIINLIKNHTPKSALEICLENKKNCETNKQNKINIFNQCVSDTADCNKDNFACREKHEIAYDQCIEKHGDPDKTSCVSCF